MDACTRIAASAHELLESRGDLKPMYATGEEMVARARETEFVSTDCNTLNEMFRGDYPEGRTYGVETGAMTEVYGEFGSGKTQFCLKMAVMAQLPRERGGIDSNVIYMDLENIYHLVIGRLETMAGSVGLDPPTSVHKRMRVFSPHNYLQQKEALPMIERLMRKDNCRFVLIAGSMSKIRDAYSKRGREGLPDRGGAISGIFNSLKRMASMYNAAVLVSNQAQANPDAFTQSVGSYGGTVFAHIPQYRVWFRKPSQRPYAMASIVDSPRHARTSYEVWISDTGLRDVKVDVKQVKPSRAPRAAPDE